MPIARLVEDLGLKIEFMLVEPAQGTAKIKRGFGTYEEKLSSDTRGARKNIIC